MAKEHSTPTQSTTATAPTSGWHPFWDLRQEIENLFDEFYSGNALAPFRRSASPAPRKSTLAPMLSAARPNWDVIDKDDEIKIVADLPGMDEADIDLEVTDSTLTLSGEKKEASEEGDKEGDYYLCERRFGAFRRSIRLPEGIDHDKIEAHFKNGVLTVHLPKTPEARHPSRKIEVKALA